uniref:Uncharacterized protein n=1 Tax=Photinus pyralis TaxID=7054 RepID=A0A1Y1LZU1_PHOPY
MRQLRFWGHIHRRSKDHILQVAKNLHAAVWKVGRPCFTWNTTIDQAIEASGIPRERWVEWSRDKQQMKTESRRMLEVEEESDISTSSQEEDADETESNTGERQQ